MIDEKKLATLLHVVDDPAKRKYLVDAFKKSASEHIEKLCCAVDEGDQQAFFVRAHSLKGSAGTMGLTVLAKLCSDVEEKGCSISSDEMAQFSAAVHECYDESIQALNRLFELGSGS